VEIRAGHGKQACAHLRRLLARSAQDSVGPGARAGALEGVKVGVFQERVVVVRCNVVAHLAERWMAWRCRKEPLLHLHTASQQS
jgi:hypothetical protein